MTIKSSFFPNQALQGQDIPSHVTWGDLNYDRIIVVIFDEIELFEIYNVNESDYNIKNNEITINKVETEGYLGVVFSTKTLKEKSLDRTMFYKFIYEDKIIEEISYDIHLFRPDIILVDVPKEIIIDFKDNTIESKIHIKNYGEGTAIIDVITRDDSEIIKREPEWVRKFNKEYVKSVEYGMEELKDNYDEYEDIIEELKHFIIHSLNFEEDDLNKLEIFLSKLVNMLRENEEFRYALSRTLMGIMLENPEYSSVYQFVSEYINSITEEKMLLKDPFNVIDVSSKGKMLSMSIKCIDLLNQICTEHHIDKIKIIGNDDSEIPLYKLFQWGDIK